MTKTKKQRKKDKIKRKEKKDRTKKKELEDEKSFQLLEGYQNHNPGTISSLERNINSTFRRLFLRSFAAQLTFEYCRPNVILDTCHMRSQYGGIIMSECAHDREGMIVPLAIGVADIENEDSWAYFLRYLAQSIPKIKDQGMIITHDREKGLGLHNAQAAILPNSNESVCVFHLEKNVNAEVQV